MASSVLSGSAQQLSDGFGTVPARGMLDTGQVRRPMTTTKFETLAADPGSLRHPAARVSQPAIMAGGRRANALQAYAALADQVPDFEPHASMQSRAESIASSLRYTRTWSIQEALDQHSTLCRQKELLAKAGANRVHLRRTQLQFAKLEVEEFYERAHMLAPAAAADAKQTQAAADQLQRLTQDLTIALQLRRADEAAVLKQLSIAEAEILKSREEMKVMRETIDDKSLVAVPDNGSVPLESSDAPRKHFYCTNCKVGGHGKRFSEYLLKRPDWRVYPYQKWFEDDKKNEYFCPLGKRLVDFADETHFSRLAMYIKGRVWLEDKTKMWELVPDLMPETYCIVDRTWRDGRVPPQDAEDLPWFVKEADRNWGTSVNVCQKASECMDLAKPGATYVVQQHIRDPLCMDDGRKCHIKFYVLLMCLEDGMTWRVYTFEDGYLSISPNKWSPHDISKETQVTIIRTERVASWRHWTDVYPKCKAGVAEVVRRSVAQGKLEGRMAKRQFEILSSDFIVDTHGNVWLFEFNMSPVLKDPQESPEVHDADMITAALDIVLPWEHGSHGKWDLAGEFIGEPPKPKAEEKAA
mmetsp:Transcript_85749/g.156223  ORF Transcript_85749/g.156223 Transcript_85749/m.156223 type:complete len:582 (-) Transcript_85749:95-1840(-)